MIRPDELKALILDARHADAVPPPFPSGVRAGDDRTSYLNASESGRCSRWLWYARHTPALAGPQPYGVFDRGHAAEHWAATYLAAGLETIGGKLLYTGENQRRLILSEARLAGTPDGLVQWADGSESVLEIKSHGNDRNYDCGPAEMHVAQTEMNIELFHEVTEHRPEDGIILYVLAEDYGRIVAHRIERRPAVFIEMLGKVAALDAPDALSVTAEGAISRQCVICPFRPRCSAAIARGIPAAGTGGLDGATLLQIDQFVHARQRAVEATEEAARACREAGAAIVAAMTEGKASIIKRNGYAVKLMKTTEDGQETTSLEIRSA